MDEQREVATSIETHGMESPPTYRLLDLVSELREVAKNAAESTDYGDTPENLDIESDEIGDVLFSLLAVADAVDVDAGDALEEALTNYEGGISEDGTAASGD